MLTQEEMTTFQQIYFINTQSLFQNFVLLSPK